MPPHGRPLAAGFEHTAVVASEELRTAVTVKCRRACIGGCKVSTTVRGRCSQNPETRSRLWPPLVAVIAGAAGLAGCGGEAFDKLLAREVAFTSPGARVSEAAGEIHVPVVMDIAATKECSIPLTFGGTATLGVDYLVQDGPAVIRMGTRLADIVVTLVDDGEVEGERSIEISLGQPSAAHLGALTQHVITVADDDANDGTPSNGDDTASNGDTGTDPICPDPGASADAAGGQP
jgi:hypothetical protein